MTKLPLKQFVRGKLLGLDRPSYEVVAKSRNIDDAGIQSVVQAFNGSQPLATEISNHDGAWLISPIGDEEIALLRQERSLEKEFGRHYFLYEHYKIFNKKNLKRIHKIWLISLTQYQQEVFKSITQLDDQIDIDEDFLIKTFSSTLADLFTSNNNDSIGDLAIQHLYVLLHKQKLKVSGTTSDINRMISALSLILPSSQSNNYKVYIGKDLPYSWNWDIAFLINSGWGDTNPLTTEKILSEKINNSYTKIIYKILHSRKTDWQDLPDRLDKIKLDTIHNQNDLESTLGNAIFQDIGLRLINFDIQLKRANAEDVHIAWKELSDLANSKDIKLILPVILEDESAWDTKDYDALSKSVTKHKNVVIESLSILHKNSPEKFLTFLEAWLEKHPSQKELDFIGNMLFDLNYQIPSLLLRVLQKKDDMDYKLLVLLFECKVLSDSEVLSLTNSVLRKAKTKKELTEIISGMSNRIQNNFLHQMMKYLILAANNDDTTLLKKEYALILEHLSGVPSESRDVLSANLLVFAMNLKLENALVSFLFEKQSHYKFIRLIDITRIWDSEIKATNTFSNIISAAYVIVLYETNNKKQAVHFLTNAILDDIKKYESIVDILQKSSRPNDYAAISLEKLNELTNEGRAKTLVQYISIKKFISSEEKVYLMDFLKNISYSPSIINQLEKVYQTLLKTGAIDLCQLILELQIRDAIVMRNHVRFEEKINSLANLPHLQKKGWRNRIVVDYLNTLFHSPEKQDFIKTILFESYSSLSNPKPLKRALVTSLIFKDNFRKFYGDINCRLEIYRWIHKEYSAHSKT